MTFWLHNSHERIPFSQWMLKKLDQQGQNARMLSAPKLNLNHNIYCGISSTYPLSLLGWVGISLFTIHSLRWQWRSKKSKSLYYFRILEYLHTLTALDSWLVADDWHHPSQHQRDCACNYRVQSKICNNPVKVYTSDSSIIRVSLLFIWWRCAVQMRSRLHQ